MVVLADSRVVMEDILRPIGDLASLMVSWTMLDLATLEWDPWDQCHPWDQWVKEWEVGEITPALVTLDQEEEWEDQEVEWEGEAERGQIMSA